MRVCIRKRLYCTCIFVNIFGDINVLTSAITSQKGGVTFMLIFVYVCLYIFLSFYFFLFILLGLFSLMMPLHTLHTTGRHKLMRTRIHIYTYNSNSDVLSGSERTKSVLVGNYTRGEDHPSCQLLGEFFFFILAFVFSSSLSLFLLFHVHHLPPFLTLLFNDINEKKRKKKKK